MREAWKIGRVFIPAVPLGFGALLALCLFSLLPAPNGILAQAGAPPTPTPTTVPFLYAPFAGGYPITAYLDHQRPDYTWDDTVVVHSGEQAHAIDGIWKRSPTFLGGYWQPESGRLLYYDGHAGVDYGVPLGTTVLAAAPGEVSFAGSVPSGCETPLTYVILDHGTGYRTYYVHLHSVCVSKGDRLEAGDPLGISGSSGCSTGPHLHFGVEHAGRMTDPYGWDDLDQPDPLLAYSGEAASWLWAAGAPPTDAPPAEATTDTLTGRLTAPGYNVHTNGDLTLTFVSDPGCPPLSRVEFWAYYASALEDGGPVRLRWHRIGVDRSAADLGGSQWSLLWDTRHVPEGPVWLHVWAVDEAGQVGKGSPIHDSVTIDRHPPLGRLVGLLPGGVAGQNLWLYVLADDISSASEPSSAEDGSGVQQVDLLARTSLLQSRGPTIERSAADWIELGQARRQHGNEWLLLWTAPDALDGAVLDIAARLTDRAGNTTLTEPVGEITIDVRAPLGRLDLPPSGVPLTTSVELVFVPSMADVPGPAAPAAAGIDEVTFWAWYDEDWHLVGEDTSGLGGWQARWDPARVDDQVGVRLLARPSSGTTVYTALPQITDLALDRTPPSAGYVRPRSEGVARPDVAQRVWAHDAGSGVARVEFYADWGEGWVRIGEQDGGVGPSGADVWSISWDADGVPDGWVDLRAQAVDRAGNAQWTEPQRRVALDRAPPEGGLRVEPPVPAYPSDGATHTLFADVTDAVSGLDRAIFYARLEGGGWRHLGVDTDPEDGLRLRWNSAALGVSGEVTFTAWVYDRAGNQVELDHVAGVWVEAATPAAEATAPTATPSPWPSPTFTPASVSPTPTGTATQARQDPTATATTDLLPEPTAFAAATPTSAAAAVVAAPATATLAAMATIAPAAGPPSALSRLTVQTLIAACALAALVMVMVLARVLARRG